MEHRADGPEPRLPERWGGIQMSLARLASISLTTLDRRGRTVAAADERAFCRLLRENPEGARICAESCGTFAARAVADNRIHYYRCPAGLQCFAAPLRVEGAVAGSIVGGRSLEKAADVDSLFALGRRVGLPEDAVRRAVAGLPMDGQRSLPRAADLVVQTAEALFTGEHRLRRCQGRLSLLTALLNLGAELGQERDPLETHATIVESVAILFDVEGACLLVFDEKAGRYRLATAFGALTPQITREGFSPEGSVLAPVLRERAPHATTDLHRILSQGFPEGVRSLAVFPLLAGDKVLGLLCVFNTHLGAEGTQLLSVFCNQAGLALRNAMLREQLRRREEELGLVARAQELFSPMLSWDDLLETIFEEAASLTSAGQASLMLLDRRERTLRVKSALGRHAAILRAVSMPAGEGIAGRVAEKGQPLLVEDVERTEEVGRPRRPRYRTGSFLIVPLKIQERVIGVINLADKSSGAAFTAEDMQTLNSLTALAACALQRSALQKATRSLRRMAATDPLTGLANRRRLQERLDEEVRRSRRHGMTLSLVMLDLDDFKEFNDRCGHQAGDRLLQEIAQVIRRTVRDVDIVARYGGEEFAILSPQTDIEEAVLVAERVREAVAAHPVVLPGAPSGTITLSAGAAACAAAQCEAQELVRRADLALYDAKRAGKNRVARATG